MNKENRSELNQLKKAGWAELWRDPNDGKLWIRTHAMNILRSRKGAAHVSTEDVRNCIEGRCHCNERAARPCQLCPGGYTTGDCDHGDGW